MLKRKKDGSFIVTSPRHVRAAVEEMALLDSEVERINEVMAEKCAEEVQALTNIDNDREQLRSAINSFVLEAESYEDEDVKITRVQGFRRSWNVSKLEAILPRGVFKNIVKMEADPNKIDEYVRKGKINRDTIAAAFEETPNQPYVRWTDKAVPEAGSTEADDLAEALG